jgi:hypothetical protein
MQLKMELLHILLSLDHRISIVDSNIRQEFEVIGIAVLLKSIISGIYKDLSIEKPY